ncbi:MAG TPA: CHAT domain-containing protein, partial [Candidatus Polarisedimenticolaceae bacterium]|nr:CHAT domain-containing protein [Candidatus Polarisedimenticolaceae bacterium]
TARLRWLTEWRGRMLEELSRSDPAGAALLGARPPDPAETMRLLGPDETVLEYVEAGGWLHLFRIERHGVQAVPHLAAAEPVRELCAWLRFQFGKGVLGEAHAQRFGGLITATIRGYLERLHELLLDPVAGDLDGRIVRIVPHGPLHGLPFHALERHGTALIDRCQVAFAPSLAAVGLLGGAALRRGAPLLLAAGDRAAPHIEEEVERLRRHLPGARVYRGRAATRRALRLGERRPPLLHVACHGFHVDNGPWSSGLRLGDAWVSLSELYALRGTAELVVLSGCETGRGTVYSGDEWVGLVRGFLQAGARSVVASLWEVHDTSTATLMDDFYRGLAAGSTVAEALAVAQRAARRRDPLPLRWAPFVVVGEPGLRIRLGAAA